jgi:hypothetical protein
MKYTPVDEPPADGPLEEARAAVAGEDSVVLSGAGVAADDAGEPRGRFLAPGAVRAGGERARVGRVHEEAGRRRAVGLDERVRRARRTRAHAQAGGQGHGLVREQPWRAAQHARRRRARRRRAERRVGARRAPTTANVV